MKTEPKVNKMTGTGCDDPTHGHIIGTALISCYGIDQTASRKFFFLNFTYGIGYITLQIRLKVVSFARSIIRT